MATNGPAGPIKQDGRGEDPRFYDWTGGLTWIAHPDEAMQRASHLLAVGTDGSLAGPGAVSDAVDLWIIDPVDAAGVDERIKERGRVVGVVVLSGYHRREASAFAQRYDVPVYLPNELSRLEGNINPNVSVLDGGLPDTTMSVVPVRSWPGWREAALYDSGSETMVVADSLVRQDAGTGPNERLAVAPYLRLWPPRAAFQNRRVNRLLVGHGPPLFEDVEAAIEAALANARSGCPAYLRHHLDYLLQAWFVAFRS